MTVGLAQGPRTAAVPPRQRTLLYVFLYVWALGILLVAHHAKVSADPGLIGEELASGYRNVVYFVNRLQCDVFATAFSGDVFYLVGSYVMPISVQSARIFKIVFAALESPLLTAVFFRFNPDASRVAAAFPGLLFPLLPSMAFFSIVATVNILPVVFALPLFLLALDFEWDPAAQRGFWWRLGLMGLLSVWSLHLYGSSVAFLAAAHLLLFARAWGGRAAHRERVRAVGRFCAYCGITTVVACWPYAYFREPIAVVRSGGRVALTAASILESARYNYEDLFVRSASYLIAGVLPYPVFPWGRGGVLIMALAAVGLFSIRRNRRILWLVVLAACGLAVTLLSGPMPGIRRATPVVVAVCLLGGCGVQILLEQRLPARRSVVFLGLLLGLLLSAKEVWSPVPGGEYLAAAVMVTASFVLARAWVGRHYDTSMRVLVALLLVPFGITFTSTYRHVHRNYSAWLQREFTSLPGRNYEETVEALLSRMRRKRIEIALADYSFDTVLMLDLMCERRNLDCVPPIVRTGGRFFDDRIPIFRGLAVVDPGG